MITSLLAKSIYNHLLVFIYVSILYLLFWKDFMRTLSSAVLLVLMLGACGLKGPLYLPEDSPLDKEKSKIEGQKN